MLNDVGLPEIPGKGENSPGERAAVGFSPFSTFSAAGGAQNKAAGGGGAVLDGLCAYRHLQSPEVTHVAQWAARHLQSCGSSSRQSGARA